MAELIEEQRENLTALNEPSVVEVSLKDYEQLDNLPKLNGETIKGNMTVRETVEIASGTTASNYTPIELVTFRNNKRVLTYMGYPIIAESVYGTGENAKFYFTYCEGGSDTTMQTNFWRKYVDASKGIITVGRTNLPLGINGKTWASPSATEITLVASDISAESGWTPSNDTDLVTKKYVDDSIPTIPVTDVKVNGSSVVAEGVASIPAIPDISGCEVTTNKVTAIDNTSTDTQYPSAKCVYDIIGDVETILADLIGGA